VAWRSQRTRALDVALQQAESTTQHAAAMRSEIVALHRELAALHRELARRDIELIDAMARVAAVTDQVRIQNVQDREHLDRIDEAIELLAHVVTSTALLAGAGPDPRGPVPAGPVDPAEDVEPAGTVIGGSIDPSLAGTPPTPGAAIVDLTGSEATEPGPVA
jgi:hypothetical protein